MGQNVVDDEFFWQIPIACTMRFYFEILCQTALGSGSFLDITSLWNLDFLLWI